jgi:mannose-6-phosphate isomerase-like protein (cupin superfamily)
MTAATDVAQRALALGQGEGDPIWFLNSRMTVKATADQTDGAFGLLESLIPPGFSPPLHVHHREDECFYVLEGELTMRCGDREFAATAGSFFLLPRDVPHSFVVEGDTPARMLTLLTPGGGESFFVEASRPAEGDGMPPAGPVDVDALRRISEKYGADIVGPPLRPKSAA